MKFIIFNPGNSNLGKMSVKKIHQCSILKMIKQSAKKKLKVYIAKRRSSRSIYGKFVLFASVLGKTHKVLHLNLKKNTKRSSSLFAGKVHLIWRGEFIFFGKYL
jgi:hypothetical protein